MPYGTEIFHCTVKGKVALTFDDGPYIYTAELLDLLKKNNVKATFFIVGNNGGKGIINSPSSPYSDVIKRMYAEGHQIASHSWSHQDLSAATPEQRLAQIIKNEIALADILGFIPTYFRPPYARSNPGLLADLGRLGYHVVGAPNRRGYAGRNSRLWLLRESMSRIGAFGLLMVLQRPDKLRCRY